MSLNLGKCVGGFNYSYKGNAIYHSIPPLESRGRRTHEFRIGWGNAHMALRVREVIQITPQN